MTNLPAKPLYRVDEVAAFWNVSERSVRAWVKTGKLDAVRIGGPDGPIRIPRSAAITFIVVFRTASDVS